MNDEKVYVLQKDLPNAKAGVEFTKNLYGHLYDIYSSGQINSEGDSIDIRARNVENNPEWFKLKEEVKPIVVTRCNYNDLDCNFYLSDGSKVTIGKRAMAGIIMGVNKGEKNTFWKEQYYKLVDIHKRELLAVEQIAFNAGRSYSVLYIDSISNSSFLKLDYKDFSDYKNNSNG